MSLWLLWVLLSSLIGQTKQDDHLLPVKDVRVYVDDTGISRRGAWVLNVEWGDEFVENTESKNLQYDIEVLHTEQMRTVHYETIQVRPNITKHYHWKWKSPLPLQCTSHSVRLRRRDEHQTGDWSPLYTYKGKDLNALSTTVLPYDQEFLVGSNITFCCIVKTEKIPLSSSYFTIHISNSTYITEPIHFHKPFQQKDLVCDDGGATVYIGYPPDDRNLTCVTRDLRFVECRWERGRDTYMVGERRETKYTLNGRDCHFPCCVLPVHNVTKWTLTARNPLGVKTISYTADLLHRVWLKAPEHILSRALHEKNVTLQWSWNEERYVSLSMICQVELNGRIYKRTFSGKGLDSIVLVDLQPSVDYTAKVQCGSSEHFYKWGDWSNTVSFRTKEDVPEAVDVWMQYLEQNMYVLWKPLTREQSHWMLTGYELTMRDSEKKIHVDPELQCHRISSGNEGRDQMISVSAKNSAGLSPPASIIIPVYPDSSVHINHISGSNGGFEMSWEESSSSSCGYVVDWFPTYSKQQCAVQWQKVPSGHLSTRIQADFEPGVRYTASVYSCTAGAPHLLQRREGYAIEQPPFGKVQNLEGKSNGRNLVLSWKEVPLDKQGGFILGYIVTFSADNSKTHINATKTKYPGVQLTLDPGSYTINVSAFTSAGKGVNKMLRITMGRNNDNLIVNTVLGSSVAAVVFIIITMLCYSRKKWLKKSLYPDIPEPKLSVQWTTKEIYCALLTDRYMKCEIQEVHSLEPPETSLETTDDGALLRSNSRLCPAYHPYQNISALPVLATSPLEPSIITTDSPSSQPCAKKHISTIENLTYNMTWPESANVSQISEPILEMQDSYLPASNFVQNNSGNKVGYKPQILTT